MAKGNIQYIYGLHTVRHALRGSPETILEACIQKDRKPSAELGEVLELLDQAGISIQRVPAKHLDELSDNARHQGVVLKRKGLAAGAQPDLDDLLKKATSPLLLLVLDGVQDPHNLGACIRSANAAGADAVIVPKDRAAPVNATVLKVASGGAEQTPVISVSNLARTLRKLRDAGVWIAGMAADGDASFYDLDLTVATAIVMGAEDRGLRQNTRQHCDHLVNLPMRGVVESLNVSVAAGICLYEVLRQRG